MPAVKYIAEPILKIEGQLAPAGLLEDILQISVEESLHLPTMFTLVINNSHFPGRSSDQRWQHQSLFEIGKSIEIGFSASTTGSHEFDDENQASLIKGEITAMEAHFTVESQAPIVVRGYDVSHRLHRGRYNRSFQNMTDTDIVNSIIGEVGITAGSVEASGAPHDYVFQENQTNMEFLRERAARNGFELFVQDGKLNFRKPTSSETVSLTWLETLHSFRVRVSSAEQVEEVEVRGWDYTQKQPIVSTKNADQVVTSNEYGKGTSTSTSFKGKPPTPKLIVVDQPVHNSAEADKIAQALVDELGGEFIHADARAEGNPKVRPGRVVSLTDMGKYSGNYYVTETRHLYQARVYTTEFSVRGLRGGNLLALLSPPVRLQPGQTFLIGKVTNNQDPQKWGRVRVKFPTLTEDHESNWARVVAIGAGGTRGFDCLPEVDDEVLVGFEHGDIHRPFIMGGVWNGTDAPPESVDESVADGQVRLRTFKTRTGHVLQFVEEDKGESKKGVYVTTVYGHKLHLNDSTKFIELKTNDGHSVKLDDQNKKIELKTNGGHTLLMDDSSSAKVDLISTGDVSIKSGTSGSTKKISLNANEITLTATSTITLTVGANKIEISTSGISIEGTQVTVKGTMKAEVEGATATLKGTAQAKVEGAMVNVEATGINTLRGSLVKIN